MELKLTRLFRLLILCGITLTGCAMNTQINSPGLIPMGGIVTVAQASEPRWYSSCFRMPFDASGQPLWAVDLVIAASEHQKDAVDTAQSTILASWNLEEEPLTPDGSPVETVVAFTTEADAPVKTDVMPEMTVPAASAAGYMIPVESDPTTASEYDAVMSEWQSADWWAGTSETQDRQESHSTAALAASLGLVVRQGQRSDARRKRKLR